MKLKELLFSTSQVAILYISALLAQFASEVLLARGLTKTNFGEYSFVIQTAAFLVSFSFLGLDQALIRRVAHKPLKSFAWKRMSFQIIGISSLVIFAGTAFLGGVYGTPWWMAVAVGMTSFGMAFAYLFSSLLRADQRFLQGQVVLNLRRYIWLFFVVFAFLFHDQLVGNAAISFPIVLMISAGFSIYYISRKKESPKIRVNLLQVYKEGIIFWIIASTLALLNSLNILMLGKLGSFEDVGTYSALWIVIGAPFVVLFSSIGYVFLPIIVRGDLKAFTKQRIFYPISAAIMVLSLAWYFICRPIITFLYSGKYSPNQTLIFLFIIAGFLQVAYAFPSVILFAKGSVRSLLYFLIFATIGLVFHSIINLVMIPQYGLLGAVIGLIADWTVRFVGAIWVVLVFRGQITQAE